MLKTTNKRYFVAIFCSRAKFYSRRGRKKGENTNDAAGAVFGAEDDALGEHPQSEVTLLSVLRPGLRMSHC